MTALAKEKTRSVERWTFRQFPLAITNKAWKHGSVGIDLSTGKVEPAHAESDLLIIGVAAETIDATSVEKQLNVNLGMEIEVEWWASSGIAATDIGKLAYFQDDQTVYLTTGGCVAGRIWAYDSVKGAAIQKLPQILAGTGGAPLTIVSPGAFASNDLVIAASPASGVVFEIPTTGAASTVTLPAAAAEGTILHFVADGTLNGHTVQYRDATGPSNLTTALTASKRHQVSAIFLNSKWRANAYVSP